jgi:signal transduction histidine kinase
MTRRLLVSYVSVTLLVLVMLEVPLGIVYSQRERERMAADVEHDASIIATIYEDVLERDLPIDPGQAEGYAARTGARVVVVDREGISRVDTGDSVDRDFSTRPEIAEALRGTRASGTRRSETLGTDLLYVAVPVASGGVVHGAVRLTLDTHEVETRIRRVWAALVAVGLVVLVATALIGWGLARSLTRPLRLVAANAEQFAEGDLTAPTQPIAGPREIRALDDTMTTMARRLHQLLDSQRVFVADASHQLRTPLTALRLRLENLQTRLAIDPATVAPAEVEAAIEETDRLAALVTDLLRLTRSDEDLHVEPTDLARLTSDRADTWTAAAEARGVVIRVGGVEGRREVLAVPGAIEQILDNLLDNALAASPTGSTIVVEVVAGEDRTCLRIADEGPGLTEEEKVAATGRFWRGRSTHPGTGLGLAIVESLVVASGGSLSLDDAPGGGLAVTVCLPSAPTDLDRGRATSGRQG